jgi:hypothetical protein
VLGNEEISKIQYKKYFEKKDYLCSSLALVVSPDVLEKSICKRITILFTNSACIMFSIHYNWDLSKKKFVNFADTMCH